MSPMFHTARRRVHPSLVLSAATVVLFTIAMLVPLSQAKAETTGDSYYDRYALPWVQRYAPPNTAPGTYGRSYDTEYPRGSRNHF